MSWNWRVLFIPWNQTIPKGTLKGSALQCGHHVPLQNTKKTADDKIFPFFPFFLFLFLFSLLQPLMGDKGSEEKKPESFSPTPAAMNGDAQMASFPCPSPGCRVVFTSDAARLDHMRTAHLVGPPVFNFWLFFLSFSDFLCPGISCPAWFTSGEHSWSLCFVLSGGSLSSLHGYSQRCCCCCFCCRHSCSNPSSAAPPPLNCCPPVPLGGWHAFYPRWSPNSFHSGPVFRPLASPASATAASATDATDAGASSHTFPKTAFCPCTTTATKTDISSKVHIEVY